MPSMHGRLGQQVLHGGTVAPYIGTAGHGYCSAQYFNTLSVGYDCLCALNTVIK